MNVPGLDYMIRALRSGQASAKATEMRPGPHKAGVRSTPKACVLPVGGGGPWKRGSGPYYCFYLCQVPLRGGFLGRILGA